MFTMFINILFRHLTGEDVANGLTHIPFATSCKPLINKQVTKIVAYIIEYSNSNGTSIPNTTPLKSTKQQVFGLAQRLRYIIDVTETITTK